MSLHAIAHASIEGTLKRATARGEASYSFPGSEPIVFGNGTGLGKADIAWDDARTLGTAASENIDLAGVLADAFGQTIVAAKVKAIEIENPATNTTNITIGAAGSNPFQAFFGGAAHSVVLQPGDRFLIASPAGWAVVAGTGDILKVTNAAGAANIYRIKIVAASA
jgi:hypothetical protein